MNVKTLNELLSDPHFIDLDIALKKYNVFRSLKVQDYEIRHSKFLGHLLNPNETHGLGTEFLTNFLLCLSNSTGTRLEISELDLDLTEVSMEWMPLKKNASPDKSVDVESVDGKGKNNRLDILLRVPLRYKRGAYFDVAVEMKWRAKQHKGQLISYTSQMSKNGITPKVSVLLTVNGEDPEGVAQDSWKGITYQDVVVPALKNTLQKKSDSTSQKVINTLLDWQDILEEASSQESSQKSPVEMHCEKLLDYKNVLNENAQFLTVKYPSAYEKLQKFIEESEDTRGRALKHFNNVIHEKGFLSAYSNRSYMRFYPSVTYPFDVKIGGFPSADQNASYPLLWELLIRESENKIKTRLILTLAKLNENFSTDDRRKIVDAVRKEFHKPKWDFTNTTITDSFTRIIRSKWENSENIERDVIEKIDRFIAKAGEISENLEGLLGDTCLYSVG